jgi:geranylgeranyl pyrophosphate synthase
MSGGGRAVPGLEQATALARTWCETTELPAAIRPMLETDLMSGGAFVLLLARAQRSPATPDAGTTCLAALVEATFFLSFAQSCWVASDGAAAKDAILGLYARTLRAIAQTARKMRGSEREALARYMSTIHSHRGVCEAELARIELAMKGSRPPILDDPLVRLLSDMLANAGRLGAGDEEHPGDLLPERCTRFGAVLGKGWALLLGARLSVISDAHESFAAMTAEADTCVHAALDALELRDDVFLRAQLDAQRTALLSGRWDALVKLPARVPASPPVPLAPPADRLRGDRRAQAIADRLRAHLELGGSTIARDVAHAHRHPAGKLLRGCLTMRFSELLDGPSAATLDAAVAIEEIHRASLMVDDFIDESPTRHGRPTVASRHGGHVALSVARLLMGQALAIVFRHEHEGLYRTLERTLRKMVGGARAEPSGGALPSWGLYLRMIEGKTAALFACACAAGAIVGGATPRLQRYAAAVGRALGLGFQIVDDYLDYFGTDAFGKTVGADYAAGMATAPVLLLVGTAPVYRAWVQNTLAAHEPARLPELKALMLEHDVPGRIRDYVQQCVRSALGALEVFPAGGPRDDLAALIAATVERQA